jgi:hypothetical protein
MRRIVFIFTILAVAFAGPARATEDNFVPRLRVAIQTYLQAYEVCLRRVIAASPISGVRAEQIATAAVKTCREHDADIRLAKKRVYGFPSVDNFMSETGDRIFAFSVQLARSHISSLGLW